MNDAVRASLQKAVKKMLREGKYQISSHATDDYPEWNITAADIIECLKIGDLDRFEPREVDGVTKYLGSDRYRWYGQDQKDRVLRLIIAIDDEVITVSAAEAGNKARDAYLASDTVTLGQIEDESKNEGGSHGKM